MPEMTGPLYELALAAADAQRKLESGVARADGGWTDDARRRFDAEHLSALRADARHLRLELEEIAAAAGQVTRVLKQTR